ncbi:lysophospholipid acyltransferase family protein [Achromobacter ruhlandii]|uniref:lysophospholipid acyltransferase family protein n=1 Tax=Achromobacter ruhlandii TaxID=72557 RepID=UPI003BA2CD2F
MAFTMFGVGGLLLRLLVFPPQRLIPGNAADRQRRARWALNRTFRFFIRFMVRVGILTVDFKGAERLGRPGQMILANHPSLLDVVFLVGHVKNANCIVKHGLARNPFTRGPVSNAGYITNDESFDMFDRAADVLRNGETLIVFPEGTRTPPGQPAALSSRRLRHCAARRPGGDPGGHPHEPAQPDQRRALVPHSAVPHALRDPGRRGHRSRHMVQCAPAADCRPPHERLPACLFRCRADAPRAGRRPGARRRPRQRTSANRAASGVQAG